MKNLTEFKKSLIICVSCAVLILVSYALLPGYSGAIPGGMQTFCTVLVVAFALSSGYRIYNDGLDSWPTWTVFITTILIVIIQLGYKSEAKANPFPSSYIQNTQKLC